MDNKKNTISQKQTADVSQKQQTLFDENTPDTSNLELDSYLKKNIPVAEVESIGNAEACKPFFQLFKELTRTNLNDFFIKMSVLLQLSSNKDKTSWTPQEMAHEFHWMRQEVRKRMIQQLSRSGWLVFNEGSYEITRFGKSILSVLSAMPKDENIEDALGANVSSFSLLEMSQDSSDPSSNLRMFINELVKIDEDIESTIASKSEYLIRKMNRQVRSQFDVAIKSREYLQNVRTESFRNYRLKQKIHEKLSQFHSRVSQVQRAQNDLVARKIILTDKSLTQHDVNSFLVNTNLQKLAEIGKDLIAHPIHVPDLVPALLVYETEWQFEKERPQDNRRGWTDEFEMANEAEDNIGENNQFLSFITEIDYTLSKNDSVALEKIVPAENWATSGFRFSMIAVLEHSELPKDMDIENGESVPKLQIQSFDDGLQLEVVKLNDFVTGVKEITKGVVTREQKE
ncbi:hypothetical protein [Candidatus Uabimicrobium amorphum]|uniref:Uncharacterized protein n=1 Tax=Uabimicrobium amorphum TaxID=2596890 RepID=A0A5S9IK24_UABAM|nr:hypothetical protein [Candidatus Uabimicrobium amorphum]BBM82035.1 hypothetical protein UABAM_00378 [Candidatus Uabimicrobium amorphum]